MGRTIVYDKIIKPDGRVLNFRGCGLTENDLKSGLSMNQIEDELTNLFIDKCIVGHNLSYFIFNFFKPKESLDLAFYNRLHYLIMAITKVRYSGMMGLSEMSNFLLGDSMDNVKSSDNESKAKTVMQIFYFVIETLQKEETEKNFKLENASRDEPFELKNKEKKTRRPPSTIITPKEF